MFYIIGDEDNIIGQCAGCKDQIKIIQRRSCFFQCTLDKNLCQAERAVRTGWQIAITAAVTLAGIAVPLFVFAPKVASFLTKDPLVLTGTVTYLHYNLSVTPFMALSLTLGGGLQGAGDTRGVMMVIIVAMWLIRLPLAYFLGVTLDWGAEGVWSAMIFSMAVQGTFMALRSHRGRWKNLVI